MRTAPRVYLKTPNAPGQRAFLRCAASFFLEIRQYSCEKMSCATQKSLAAGHIMSFQIHPKNMIVGLCHFKSCHVINTEKGQQSNEQKLYQYLGANVYRLRKQCRLTQSERLAKFNAIAIQQMRVLTEYSRAFYAVH